MCHHKLMRVMVTNYLSNEGKCFVRGLDNFLNHMKVINTFKKAVYFRILFVYMLGLHDTLLFRHTTCTQTLFKCYDDPEFPNRKINFISSLRFAAEPYETPGTKYITLLFNLCSVIFFLIKPNYSCLLRPVTAALKYEVRRKQQPTFVDNFSASLQERTNVCIRVSGWHQADSEDARQFITLGQLTSENSPSDN